MLNFGNKEFRNLQEQVLENAKNIQILKEKPGLKPVVVTELPATGEEGILYLVPKNPDPDTGDADSYDEYIWLTEKQTFEFVGSTSLNLTEVEKLGFKNPGNVRHWRIIADESGNFAVQTSTDNTNWTNTAFWNDNRDLNLLSNGLVTGSAQINGETTMKADASSSNNVWKFRPVNDSNLFITRDNSDRFLFQANMFAPATYQSPAINLGSANYAWKDLYLAGQINFGTGPSIKQDSSNRIVITGANGQDRIKIGGENSTSCAASWTPDQDNKYLLGTAQLRWKSINVGSVLNANGNLTLRGNPDVTVILGNKDSDGALTPSVNNKANLGSTSRLWKAVYTTTIADATKSVNVADIITKPNFDSPTVYAEGTLDNNGQSTIDIATLGTPTPGLYMFKYYSCQCYVTFTTENIQNAITTPILVSIPVISDSNFYAGWLEITRNADILTITVSSSNGPVSPQGIAWSIYKVM